MLVGQKQGRLQVLCWGTEGGGTLRGVIEETLLKGQAKLEETGAGETQKVFSGSCHYLSLALGESYLPEAVASGRERQPWPSLVQQGGSWKRSTLTFLYFYPSVSCLCLPMVKPSQKQTERVW